MILIKNKSRNNKKDKKLMKKAKSKSKQHDNLKSKYEY